MRTSIILIIAFFASALPARGQVDLSKLRGAWQVMSVKNLRTGAVDTISNRRLVWTQYTDHYWSYFYADHDRPVISFDEYRKLPADGRISADYAKVWSANGAIRFWGAGGIYWLVGQDRHYTNLVSIEPFQVNLGNIESVVQLDDSIYVIRSMPDKEGVQRETRERRLAFYTRDPKQPRNAQLLKGMWQVMSIRNVATGEVDDIAQRQTIWYHVTDSTWTYIVTDKDRRNTTPAELASLPEGERMQRNYDKIWSPLNRPAASEVTGGTRFWASAGKYRIVGDTINISRAISIEPSMVGYSSKEVIVQLDRDKYVYRAAPDAKGVVREFIHRRLD